MAYTMQLISSHIMKIEFIGDVTDEDTTRHAEEMDQYLAPITAENPMHFLVNVSRMGKLSAKARRVFTERNKNPLVGNTAVYGVNHAVKVLGVFITKASGRNNLRFFDSEAEGLPGCKRALRYGVMVR